MAAAVDATRLYLLASRAAHAAGAVTPEDQDMLGRLQLVLGLDIKQVARLDRRAREAAGRRRAGSRPDKATLIGRARVMVRRAGLDHDPAAREMLRRFGATVGAPSAPAPVDLAEDGEKKTADSGGTERPAEDPLDAPGLRPSGPTLAFLVAALAAGILVAPAGFGAETLLLAAIVAACARHLAPSADVHELPPP